MPLILLTRKDFRPFPGDIKLNPDGTLTLKCYLRPMGIAEARIAKTGAVVAGSGIEFIYRVAGDIGPATVEAAIEEFGKHLAREGKCLGYVLDKPPGPGEAFRYRSATNMYAVLPLWQEP